MPETRDRVTITIPKETLIRLLDLAEQEDRTTSNMASILLKDALDRRNAKETTR